jgi:hypothetical protein
MEKISTNSSEKQHNDIARVHGSSRAERCQKLTPEQIAEQNKRFATDNPYRIGAEEVPEFVPTRNELIQLVKYWTKKTIDIDYFYFLWGQEEEWRLLGYANSRLSKIAYLLGNAEVERAIAVAYDEYGSDQDPKLWDIFLNGTAEDRKQVQDDIWRHIEAHIDCGSRCKNESPITEIVSKL